MPESDPFIIGVTGNIACGKSLVSSILTEFGAEVIDADLVAHEVMAPGSPVLANIAERFGDNVLNHDESLNRPALGQIVFGDPEALADLEQITHPPTVEEILQRAKQANAQVVVIDAIKLFEAGLADHCKQNWVVTCDPEIQRQRLMERNGFSAEQAQQRIDAQPVQEEKAQRADVVIDNSGDVPATRSQVMRAWNHLPLS
jgi:dephospho-CoA kinase